MFCHRWALVSVWLVASFCFQVKVSPARVLCVWGIDEAKAFAVLWLVGHEGFAGQILFVFWFVLFCGMLLGVWGNTGLLFYKITP